MQGEKVDLPKLADLQSIRFEERRPDGGFTEAILTLLPDGTGVNAKRCRYDDPKVYESTKPVDKETVDAIKKTMEETGILAWADLPDSDFRADSDRTLTFIFSGGGAVTIRDGTVLPDPLSGAFFAIQLELETKH